MWGEIAEFLMPSSTPAMPASSDARKKVTSTTWLTLTPKSAAVSWLSEVARMARPIRVRPMNSHSAVIETSATTRMNICTELMVTGPKR